MHGLFTLPGQIARPFIYEVEQVSNGRSNCSRRVIARHPLTPSFSAEPPYLPSTRFGKSDATKELGGVCFTCLCSFKLEEDGPGHQEVKDFRATYSLPLEGKWQWDHPLAPSADVGTSE